MGRGKMEAKRIGNTMNEHVSFCKPQNGLLKKAYEFLVLCDAKSSASWCNMFIEFVALIF